jgi:hypothetical protein
MPFKLEENFISLFDNVRNLLRNVNKPIKTGLELADNSLLVTTSGSGKCRGNDGASERSAREHRKVPPSPEKYLTIPVISTGEGIGNRNLKTCDASFAAS